jgi:hypothetical protein
MNQAKTCQNAMELLVDQEVKRQLVQLPENLLLHLNLSEVATYALNRLPPLYSYSEEGWRQQKLRGEQKLSHQITKAVHQAFVVIAGEMALHSTPVKQSQNEDYKSQRKNTTSALRHRASSSPRLSVVNMASQPKAPKPEADGWGNSFYLR